MKMKSLLLLAVAVGCGLVALLGVQQVLSNDKNDGIERVRVLVARTEIEPGVPLDKENCELREVPKDTLPENPVTLPEQYQDRALTSRAYANQVIGLSQLGEKGVFGAAINIPDGMRVVTIPVNATGTHSGMLKPGDRVDVMATFQVSRPGLGQALRSKTILEYIEVFATDSKRIGLEEPGKTPDKESVKNVSLLVWPKQAIVLKLAESKGTVHLAMRSKTDTKKTETGDIDEASLESMQSIFDEGGVAREVAAARSEPESTGEKPSFSEFLAAEPEAVEAAPSAKPTWKVTIYAGGDKKVEEVELPEAEATDAPKSAAAKGNWMKSVGRFFGATAGK